MNATAKVAVTEDVTDEFCSNTEYSVYLYTLELKIEEGKGQKTSFSWPQMSPAQMKVFHNLKRIF